MPWGRYLDKVVLGCFKKKNYSAGLLRRCNVGAFQRPKKKKKIWKIYISSNIFEKLISRRIYSYFNKYYLISDSKYSYTSGYSTETATGD